MAFIFTDAEVKDEAFLEYINQLLMTGGCQGGWRREPQVQTAMLLPRQPTNQPPPVPLLPGEIAGLFPKDELDVIVNDIRPTMRAECPGERSSTRRPPSACLCRPALPRLFPCCCAISQHTSSLPSIPLIHPPHPPGVPDTWDNLHNFFINRVRDRLHLVRSGGLLLTAWWDSFGGREQRLADDRRSIRSSVLAGAGATWPAPAHSHLPVCPGPFPQVLCFSPVGKKFARWAQQASMGTGRR